METPRHEVNDQGGPPGHVGNLHEHAARRRAVVRCSDAVLSRHDDQLTIGWDDGAVLAMPMAWCRDIRANLMAEGVGTQIVLRFAPGHRRQARTTTPRSWRSDCTPTVRVPFKPTSSPRSSAVNLACPGNRNGSEPTNRRKARPASRDLPSSPHPERSTRHAHRRPEYCERNGRIPTG